MSRTALHSHHSQYLGHQSTIPTSMKHPGGDDQKPSRLMQMREDYQRRLLKEKEEKLVHMYEDSHRKTLERAERVTRGPPPGAYPNSKLPQPGGHYSHHQNAAANGSSVRDFFRERRELESKGAYMPPIKHHYNQARSRTGSGNSQQKSSAGIDRAQPLAPIKARHSGVSSAPSSQPAPFNNKSRLLGRHSTPASHPDTPDENDNYAYSKPNSVRGGGAPRKPDPPSARAPPSHPRGVKRDAAAARPQEEKISDFQRWQMDQNKAREDRLKKLNMRAPPPTDRESAEFGVRHEYEDEDEDEEEAAPQSHGGGQGSDVARQQRELMEKIALQQAELNRMRKEREEEEERERLDAELLRKQEAADRERRRRQQQEDARRRREEEAQARREEQEEQRRAAAEAALIRQQQQQQQQQQDRQHRYYDEDDDDDPANSAPNTYRSGASGRRPFGGSRSQQATPRDRPPPAEFSQRKPNPPPQPPPARRQPPAPQNRYRQQRQPEVEQEDETPVPGPGVDFYAQAALQDEQGGRVKLVSCKQCGRKFAADRIEKHQAACKNAQKKRKAFDPTKMRTDGTEMAKYISKNAHKKEPLTKKKADWRRQHDDFIANIRYAKQMQQMEQQGVALKDLPPPPPTHNPDLVPCPNCGRTFNVTAAERHIPRCKELKTRPAANRRR